MFQNVSTTFYAIFNTTHDSLSRSHFQLKRFSTTLSFYLCSAFQLTQHGEYRQRTKYDSKRNKTELSLTASCSCCVCSVHLRILLN